MELDPGPIQLVLEGRFAQALERLANVLRASPRGDRIGGADVVFGEEGDSVLSGAFTLGAVGLLLDPLRREL